jgi:DNA polymerase-3 subunit delta'
MIKKNKIEVKHPRFNDEFFGFKEIEEYFLHILKKKKLSNAYIFNGIKGIGKATFAYRLARCILNKDNNLKSIDSLNISKENNIFKNIMNLSHPDIKIIEPDNENKKINLEKIKLLNKFTFGTSLESDYKIIIIDSLDDFTTKKSFSSLLKLLEDCPINCIFFLISHLLFKVPGTIKSRCQKIYFNPISDKTLRKWFEQSEIINEKNLDILINLSNGSLGRALDIINNNESFDIYSDAKKIINNFPNISKADIYDFFSLFNSNFLLEDFLLIIQINIIQNIKELIKKKNIDKTIIDVYISLFFEINKKINNFKMYDLDSLQTLNTIKYIFIKHSENLNKLKKNG